MAEEIRDISLSTKRAFSIDGDLNRIIHIDTSDLNILSRLEETYPEMDKLAIEASERVKAIADTQGDDESGAEFIAEYAKILKDIDSKMREKIDFIFASPISDICVPDANMYDPVGGEFRYEQLIEKLSVLYANDLASEFKKMKDKVKKHTAKYTGRRGKK